MYINESKEIDRTAKSAKTVLEEFDAVNRSAVLILILHIMICTLRERIAMRYIFVVTRCPPMHESASPLVKAVICTLQLLNCTLQLHSTLPVTTMLNTDMDMAVKY